VTAAAVERIHAALPQTQCTRCGYPDCHAYAQAIALEGVAINRCPPGGAEGIERLAQLTGRPAEHLDPDHGVEGPRTVAFIDENWCIGCTLCLDACPTDAIVGSHKVMHTVLEPWCTGCELCIPVCPVDCIELEPVTGAATGWAAWSAPQAAQALQRYEQRKRRLERRGDRTRPAAGGQGPGQAARLARTHPQRTRPGSRPQARCDRSGTGAGPCPPISARVNAGTR
jgi:electron transport complex protein RnfB